MQKKIDWRRFLLKTSHGTRMIVNTTKYEFGLLVRNKGTVYLRYTETYHYEWCTAIETHRSGNDKPYAEHLRSRYD